MVTLRKDIEDGVFADNFYAISGGGKIIGAYEVLSDLTGHSITAIIQRYNSAGFPSYGDVVEVALSGILDDERAPEEIVTRILEAKKLIEQE